MKLPKLNRSTFHITIVGLIALFILIGVVYFKQENSFSVSVPLATTTPPDNYSETATALSSNPSESAATTTANNPAVATAAVYSLDNNDLLWSYNPGKTWPIASISKLMTAVVAMQLIPMDQKITITATDEQYLINAGAVPTYKVGDTLTAQDLMTSMFIVSSDDAAEALADYYGRAQFLSAMNNMAGNLGMTNTHFVSPSGLSTGNLSTTADLYKLIEFIWTTQPSFFQTTRETEADVTVYTTSSTTITRVLTNIDEFAGRADFLGGKTGTLEPVTGENLVSIFSVKGEPDAIIVLGANNRYTETEKILSSL